MSPVVSDPRHQFLADIDLQKTHVLSGLDLIVVCGGALRKVRDSGPPKSARDRLLSKLYPKLPRNAVWIPETIDDWSHEEVYPDLLQLETDLASLTAVLVLITESAGSLAELGSFSCIPEIASKLLVFIDNTHYEADSFIRLGPIKHLEKRYGKDVRVYPFGEEYDASGEFFDEICNEILLERQSSQATKAFRSDNVEHRLLLICDLVELFLIVKPTELLTWMKQVFEADIHESTLRRYVYLLEKLGVLSRCRRGKDRYIVRTPESPLPFIEYGTKSGTFKQERTRLKAKVQSHFLAHDPIRFDVYAEYRKALGSRSSAEPHAAPTFEEAQNA